MFSVNIIKEGFFVVTFDDLQSTVYKTDTNILIVRTENRIYVCDTYLTPSIIEAVFRNLGLTGLHLPVVVINSHSHWDHIGGNGYFAGSDIYASKRCIEKFTDEYQYNCDEIAHMSSGRPELVPPNIGIDGDFYFTDDRVRIFVSPGHSDDSVCVFFENGNLLFCGDNAEYPIPTYCTITDGGAAYRDTLKKYIDINAEYYIPGHGRIMGIEDVKNNLTYVGDLVAGNTYGFENRFEKHTTNRLA